LPTAPQRNNNLRVAQKANATRRAAFVSCADVLNAAEVEPQRPLLHCSKGTGYRNKGIDNGNKSTDNGNKGTDNGNKGTDNGN
jgi:hypothetical protein